MQKNIITFAFSKHNNLPRTSIFFAVCFLVGFIALNIFSFSQNNRRIALIETMNHQNLPAELLEIDEILMRIDAVLDDEHSDGNAKQAAFENQLSLLKNNITQLQRSEISSITSLEITKHFIGSNDAIEKMIDLEKNNGFANAQANTLLMSNLHEISAHFFQINKLVQAYEKNKINEILNELRSTENLLLGISLAFVVLGSIMIVFLLIDLLRRGELLERAHQADRLKNSFFAMMSHEIRTPINGILGTLSLLFGTKLDGNQRHLADVAHNSASSLLAIVNDVLDYSKIEAGKLELEYSDFKIKDLLESVFELIRPLADGKKLQFLYRIEGNIPAHLHCDPARIRQILLNFLSNAIKFTDHGSVTLLVKEHMQSHTPMLLFEVVDTGMGISDESKSHLFQEFSQVDGSYTRRFAGTGLGLAICRRLTEMMKGAIGVDSVVGKGSTFWFTVPQIEAKEKIPELTAPTPIATRHGAATLLLVEDNPTNQMIAEAFLKQGGHKVDVVDNGKKAVQAVASKNYDVVFMDIAMPVMDGFEATKAIRAMPDKSEIPIIAMTAHAMRGDREECLAAGMNDYIAKPLSKETLLQLVGLWAKQHSTDTIHHTPPIIQNTPKQEAVETDPEISDMHFNQLLEDLGAEHLADFSKRFYDDLLETGAAMIDGLHQEKWDVVKLHAHSLKSSTLSFGLLALSQHASAIEQQCKEKKQPDHALLDAWPAKQLSAITALNDRFKSLNIASLG
jgi:signal transduction histidine kinase/CheY-like chemotaxis protein/HPt (histidine-containing phosphotransfer) domain-containing protein